MHHGITEIGVRSPASKLYDALLSSCVGRQQVRQTHEFKSLHMQNENEILDASLL